MIYLTDAIKIKIDNKLKNMVTEPWTISHIGILGSMGHKFWFRAPNFKSILYKSHDKNVFANGFNLLWSLQLDKLMSIQLHLHKMPKNLHDYLKKLKFCIE